MEFNHSGKKMGLKSILITLNLVLILVFAACSSKDEDEIARIAPYRYRVLLRADIEHDILVLEKKISGSPQAVESGMLAALYFSQSRLTGNFDWLEKAEKSAEVSLKIMPERNAAAKLVLARIAESKHDFNKAIRLAEEARMEDPSKVSSLSVLANSQLAKGNLEEAGVYADQTVDRFPGLESYGLRALILAAEGREAEATSDFERALEIEDIGESQESARIRTLFARFLMRKGDYAHAHILLDEALKTIPKYHLALDILGDLAVREKNFSAAEQFYKDAFSSSKQLAYLVHLSHLKLLQGNKKLAEEIQNQAVFLLRAEMEKNGIGHRLDLASVLLDRGHSSDIEEALRLANEDNENRHSAIALSVKARAESAAGNASKAREIIRKLLATGVREAEFYYQAANIEEQNKNPRQTWLFSNLAIKENAGRELNFLVASPN